MTAERRRQEQDDQPTRVASGASAPLCAGITTASGTSVPCSLVRTLRRAQFRSSRSTADVVAALLGLRAHQPAIGAVAADQLGMAAGLDDPAVIDDEDAVGADHAREAMRQDQGRAALRQPVEPALDDRLVLGIDRGQGLVEDQDRRIAQQRPGDRQALALAARQIDAALADQRLVAVRQLQDEVMRVGVARGGFELGLGRIRLAEAQILLDRAVEQIGVLVHHGDLAAQRLGIEGADILAADPHHPGLRVEEAQQQPGDR